ncbi:MAG: hypothetical protein ABSE95_12955 [Thermodesulfobacteriota bacterium]|jgi:hypothetical protein
MDNNSKTVGLILADAHVHIYQGFSLETLLSEAFENFKKVVSRKGLRRPWVPFLLLTETKSENWFSVLSKSAAGNKAFSPEGIGRWSFQNTHEDCSLYGQLNEDEGFFLIAGRQIKAEGNLEVLALGSVESFEEGRPVKELIQTIHKRGAIAVIPWGAGKWLGTRGRTIKNLFQNQEVPPFFLGDTRNRPVFWPKSSIFRQAERKGLKTLTGSDPLPLLSHQKVPGSYGFRLTGEINSDYPFKSIKKLLLDPKISVVPYGRQEGPFRFFWDQFCLRAKAGK